MADTSQRLSPLNAAYQAGDFGAVGTAGPGLNLSERRDLSMVQVEAVPGAAADSLRVRLHSDLGLDLPENPNTSSGDDSLRMIWVGPDRWLLVEPESRDLEAHLFTILQGLDVAVVDLSHARGAMRLSGPQARQVLAKGAGLDFHTQAFTPDCAAQTALFHFSALIDCVDATPSFDLYAARGYCLSLWQSLCHAGAEYGYRIE